MEALPQSHRLIKGKRIIFVTNNSTKSRADYCKKLQGLGIPATTVRLPTCASQLNLIGRSLLVLVLRRRLHLENLEAASRKT